MLIVASFGKLDVNFERKHWLARPVIDTSAPPAGRRPRLGSTRPARSCDRRFGAWIWFSGRSSPCRVGPCLHRLPGHPVAAGRARRRWTPPSLYRASRL